MADADRRWNFAFLADRAKFEVMLDRVEAAQSKPSLYGLVEHYGDVEIARQFVERWWDLLDHADQHRYLLRLRYLSAFSRSSR